MNLILAYLDIEKTVHIHVYTFLLTFDFFELDIRVR